MRPIVVPPNSPSEYFAVWPLPVAQRVIIFAGCLATIYTQFTMSPATVEYARTMGATGVHIGILAALPTGMLFTQFLTAWIATGLRFRRRTWMAVSLVQRTIYLPVAFGPWLVPGLSESFWLWALMFAAAANYGMLHFGSPLWLSWMGDYLPPQGLNRFWGARQLWMQWTAAGTLGLCAVVLLKCGLPIRVAFTGLLCFASLAGVLDILCFIKVHEPPVTASPTIPLAQILAAPFQDRNYRTFIFYSCFWHFAAMLGAPFISLYLLSYIGMDLFQVLILWSLSWIGGAVVSHWVGRFADTYGNRPLLVLCTAFKSVNMLALLLVPPDPAISFWLLIPVLMVDAMLNAGIENANKGFMLLNSPTENRTVFIAAGTALAGMIGCITAIVAGGVLTSLEAYRWSMPTPFGSMLITNFHLLFAFSFLMRLMAVELARWVREPGSILTRNALIAVCGLNQVGAPMLKMIRQVAPSKSSQILLTDDDSTVTEAVRHAA
ncbi:MAG: Major Facilitator Superfamily protein [Planctomycetaceae bacterium]|nr:Major Facilitator Superfamily protein [Planctomycetaceae bacterium]